MRLVRYIPFLVLLTGCSVEHGQVDFVSPPLFQVPLGDYRALMFFSNSTVLRMGGGYYILSVPFWAPRSAVPSLHVVSDIGHLSAPCAMVALAGIVHDR